MIDIPESKLWSLKNEPIKENFNIYELASYIDKGTPLPKGHGRLIDVNELLKEKRCFEDFGGDTFNIIHEESVINAETIIEADKEN